MTSPRPPGPLDPERAEALLGSAPGLRIAVVGDVMLDRYVHGRVDRISPEAPVPVVRAERESELPGGAGNVAANVVALGARCHLIGIVGDDPEGEALREVAESAGVASAGLVADPTRPTTVKTRIVARRQQVARVDRESEEDVDEELARTLAERTRSLVPSCDAVVLEDYNKGVLVEAVIGAALEAAREAGIPTVVDPKRIRFFAYGGCTVFKPNARELAHALGERLRPDSAPWLEAVRRRVACETLLLTLGEGGIALSSPEAGSVRIPAAAREIYDVSGAGDTVTAIVAVAAAAGAGDVEAALLGNHAAAVEVGKAGVATVLPGEILARIRGPRRDEAAGPAGWGVTL